MFSINTQSNMLLELIAICGELPVDMIERLKGSETYKEKLITTLKNEGLIKYHNKNMVKGYRVSSVTKKNLLADNYDRFAYFLDGISQTSRVRSEATKRLRLHRIAETFVMMNNSAVKIYRDEKPDIFSFEKIELAQSTQPYSIVEPCFYNSHEIKEIGQEANKINNSRAVGVMLTPTEVYLMYNTTKFLMKWNYKSEMRIRAVMQSYICQNKLSHQYRNRSVRAITLGNEMEIAYTLLKSDGGFKRNYFVLDGNYDYFHFVPNNESGEIQLKLLCDNKKAKTLNKVLVQNLKPLDQKLLIDNDAIDKDGNPVLLAYDFNMPRIVRFTTALYLQRKTGLIICFDFQKEILQRYCGEAVKF